MLTRFFKHQYKSLDNFLTTRNIQAHRLKLKMDKVYIRNAGDEKLNINFRYCNEIIDREFTFTRNINENINSALARIKNNMEKELNKRLKKGKKKSAQVADPLPPDLAREINVEFLRGDTSVSDVTFAELLNADVLKDLRLRVIDRSFAISYNEPWIANIVLPNSIMAGFMAYPSKIVLQFASVEHSHCKWFKAKMSSFGDLHHSPIWTLCGEGFFYICKNDDIGHHLKFVFTPGDEKGCFGPALEVISKNEVQAGPGTCPFETRHCFTTQKLKGNEFRVVSYNLLADLYADSDYSRTQLFPYCPPYALKIDYRKQLFLKELLGYNADLICLQEVDMKLFDSDLKTVLETPELSFKGLMAQKGTCGEGLAIFYRRDRFELLETQAINIGEGITKLPELKDLSEQIRQNEPLWQRICDRSTTLQIALLRSKENDKFLLLANTHLYFHPDADHIRLLQIGFAMKYIEHYNRKALKKLNLKEDEQKISIIFCGDFNSVPECGIFKLMTKGYVDKDSADWSSNKAEAVKNISLSQPFNIKSACGTPPYTNYTHLFAACLDYIFYQSDSLQVEQVVPLPTEDELKMHTALPSVVFPSDHLSLIADIKIRKN